MIQAYIIFHPPETKEYASRYMAMAGWLSGHNTDKFAHCALRVDNEVYELTWDGIAVYEAEKYTRPIIAMIPFYMSNQAVLNMCERIKTLIRSGYRLRTKDLLKMVMRVKPNGLLCTDFIEVILGTEPSKLSPYELFKKYYYLEDKIVWQTLSDTPLAPSVEVEIM